MDPRHGWQLTALLWIATIGANPAHAAWPSDPATNLPIRTGTGYAYDLDAASDGQGGILMAWADSRSSPDYNIYAQRVGLDGVPLWTPNGAPVQGAGGDSYRCRILDDGLGGAYVVWNDGRDGYPAIYAQHLGSNGQPLWSPNGILVSNLGQEQYFPRLARDQARNLYIAWEAAYDHPDSLFEVAEVYAQKVSRLGALLWGSRGVLLASRHNNGNRLPNLVADGVGGAIVCWEDAVVGSHRLLAQRLNSAGTPQWTAGGVDVAMSSSQAFGSLGPSVAPDGNQGIVVVWHDDRLGFDETDIRAQRLRATGQRDWSNTGRVICDAPGSQFLPLYPNSLVPDGTGGWLTAWGDFRDTSIVGAVYAQRIQSNGSARWPSDGVCVRATPYGEYDPSIASDGAGGALLAWWDERGAYDIYGQRMSDTGARLWGPEGVAVSTAPGNQWLPVHVVSDMGGGALVTWSDERVAAVRAARPKTTGGTGDVYAQRVSAQGGLGGSTVSVPRLRTQRVTVAGIAPNPLRAGDALRLRLRIPGSEDGPAEDVQIQVYNAAGRRIGQGLWRRLPPGEHSLTLADRGGVPERLEPGVYFVAVRAQGVFLRESFVVLR